jgi:hypothetical protein
MEAIQDNRKATEEDVSHGQSSQATLLPHGPKFQYELKIPSDYAHSIRLDERNGNTKWGASTILEFAQLAEYDTFTNLGIDGGPPDDFKKIWVHLVYAVKHNGRHKARWVADGHLTNIPLNNVYSGVVPLCGNLIKIL